MSRQSFVGGFALLQGFLLLFLFTSCNTLPKVTVEEPESWPDITPTQIDFVDSDGFDVIFESVLVNQDPVIVIHTGRGRPDWPDRLNAWIAAWNRSDRNGGRLFRRASGAEHDGESPTFRGQTPLPNLGLDGDSIRELRLLVGGLLDRVDTLAQNGSQWWTQERERSRRISLLRPYSLRFHLGDDQKLDLVFFHGSYSSYYPRYMQLLTSEPELKKEEKWTRSVECSCTLNREGKKAHRLISQEESSD